MTNHTGDRQEAAWPLPKQEHMLHLLEESGQSLVSPVKKRAGRKPLVSWEHLVWAILHCFLHGWHAQLEVWRVITSERVGPFAPVRVCDQAIYNRIERGETWMCWAFEHVSAWLNRRLRRWEDRSLAPFATQVLAVDVSTLDRVGRYVSWLREVAGGSPELLGGQISALFDLRLQQWARVQWWREAQDHCLKHVWTLVEQVQAGTLLLFDRGYVSFALFDALTERDVWWICRYGARVSYQIQHVCYQGDGVLDAVVYLGSGRKSQAIFPVRLLQFWYRGKHYQYLTNVLHPHTLPFAEIVRLYARRWEIELAFRSLKEFLNLHHLWSTKSAVIQVQLWCCLILAQVYHALQVEIAGEAGVEVFDVSLDVLIRFTPQWLAQGLSPFQQAVRFGREIRLIRPHTRYRVYVPWIDPAWVVPPPHEAVQPRPQAEGTTRGEETSRVKAAPNPPKPHGTGPRVCLKGGKLHLLE